MEREKHAFSFNAQYERRNTMPLIQLIIVLVVVGVILWVINSYIPMQSTIKKILNVVVVIVVIIWLLSVFGLIGNLSTIRIGK
jgi:Flp pilus assembly protein TadB